MLQLHQKFFEIAKKYKNKVAIYDQATGKNVTYKQLLIATFIVAKKISKLTEDHYIGIMVPTSAGCIVASLATLTAGKVPVMINYSTGARKNCRYAMKKCNFDTILTSKKLLEKLDIQPLPEMIFLEDIMAEIKLFDKIKGLIKSKLPDTFSKKGDIDDNSVILFTSGSEKDPKAVQLTHRNIGSNIESIIKAIKVEDNFIFIGVLPLFHVFGLTTTFWLPLLMGSSLVAHANPLDYATIARSIKKYKATIITATPTFFHGYNMKSEPGDFKTLKYAVAGGDKLTMHIWKAFKDKHGVDLCEGYGTTETSPVVSTNLPEHNRLGSIGKPLSGVKVKIIDLDTDKEVEPGNLGKILVKGDLVMKGYLGDLEETSLRIHNGWYDTGDMGMLDKDGFLWHKGRLKRFVKIGGEMISLVAVESELEKLLPENNSCCVVEVPHPTKGAEIVAAITVEDLNSKKIIKQLSETLPPIAIPKKFIYFKELPMMGNGKVNFREVTQFCINRLKKLKK